MIRPAQEVALPLDRIGKLMGLDWTTVRYYRKQAANDGLLDLASKSIPHRRAATFRVSLTPQELILPTRIPTSVPTNGLVGIPAKAPSGNGLEAPSGNEGEEIKRSEQVLRLAVRNFRVFPCKPKGKTPLVRWKMAATSNIKQVQEWLAKLPECNWAVATGEVSQVFVLDIDGTEGLQSFVDCCEQAGIDWKAIAEATLGVKTGTGNHLYFAHPHHVIRNSSEKLAPGLDIRGDGGYCIAPPSMHENGEPYF